MGNPLEALVRDEMVLRRAMRIQIPPLDTAAIRQLEGIAAQYGSALRARKLWTGLRSVRVGVEKAAMLEEILARKSLAAGRTIDQEFAKQYALLPNTTAFAGLMEICGWYAAIDNIGLLGGVYRNRAVEHVSEYLHAQREVLARGTQLPVKQQEERAQSVAQQYLQRDPEHRLFYHPGLAMHAAHSPGWQPIPERIEYRFPHADLLVWVEQGNADAVLEDVRRATRGDPKPYRAVTGAAMRFAADELAYALSAFGTLIPKLAARNVQLRYAQASIASIPEIAMPWYPKPVRQQRSTRSDHYNLENIGAPAAWRTTRGDGSAIAIIDTGCDYEHQEIADRFGDVRGHNFVDGTDDPMDDNNHGTHVGGIVAGSSCGVAPETRLYALKVLNGNGYGSMADVLRAMDWVMDWNEQQDEKICAVNLSLGSSRANPVEESMCRKLYESGVAVIAAAGNNMRGPSYPASYPNVISVAAVDRNNDHAYFSNIWNTTDISAPGVDVNSSVPGDEYMEMSGTSMATPHIAGIAALANAVVGSWDPKVFEDTLKSRAGQIGIGEDEHDGKYGAGLGKADAMVEQQEVKYGRTLLRV